MSNNYPMGTAIARDVLSICPLLMKSQLVKYLSKYPEIGDSSARCVERLINRKLIYEIDNDYVSLLFDCEKNKSTIMSFWVFLELMDEAQLKFSKGFFPFNHTFCSGKTVYDTLIYDSAGYQKLTFLNRADRPVGSSIILLGVVDKSVKSFPPELLPKTPYQLVSINTQENEMPNIQFSKVFNKKEGKKSE